MGGEANGVKQSKKLAKEGVQPRGVQLPFPVPRLPSLTAEPGLRLPENVRLALTKG